MKDVSFLFEKEMYMNSKGSCFFSSCSYSALYNNLYCYYSMRPVMPQDILFHKTLNNCVLSYSFSSSREKLHL